MADPTHADYDLAVLGGGPGGYSAAFRAADLGLTTVLIERYDTLGGVCLNVGCIPSKALLHTAAVIDAAEILAKSGVRFGKPEIDLDALRTHKDGVVRRLTGGLDQLAKARRVTVLNGTGAFVSPHELAVARDGATPERIHFKSAIIAAGSHALRLSMFPDDARIVSSTGALQLRSIPKRMLVIGGGIIGLEMATVYSTLGSRIDVVEMLDGLMPGADRDLVKIWEKANAKQFDRILLNSKVTAAAAQNDGIAVTIEVGGTPSTYLYDMALVATGRRPNGRTIGAEAAGVTIDDGGFIPSDQQMRTNIPHIFSIGDVRCQPMLAHKAVHEGHIAAEAAAGKSSVLDVRQIPSVAYTDPEIAWAGATEDTLKREGKTFGKAVFPWAASGRAIANGRDEGLTKLLFDVDTHRIIGGGIVGTHAGDLIGELCLAIEMGADATDIALTIHPHPTLTESIGMAAEVFEGVCTDLPPAKPRPNPAS